ncbi:MAG TPA: zinc ribbon domain-containing protein [Gemmatimonadales bacterium]|nr:zinc ribbon domain-containing protein [Gemmatimonadales bacterium]
MTPPPSMCPSCGSPASGKFCSACGASLVARTCAGCRADLAPQARFCHRCGRPAGAQARTAGAALPARERTAWVVAGVTCLLLLAGILFKVVRDAPAPAAPDMANAGAESAREAAGPAQSVGPAGAAPDISQMSPRERFDRLFNRVMQAAEQRDTAQVERFTPMALGAYSQLDSTNADARYHAAVLRMQVGDISGAEALADTILAQSPGHLFGYVIRGTAANFRGDTAAAREAAREFLSRYDAELRSNRIEYREHEPALEDFKQSAQAADTRRK